MIRPAWLDLLDGCYVNASVRDQGSYSRGQLYWAPMYYLTERMKYLRPTGCDPYHKRPPEFQIQTAEREQILGRGDKEESIFHHLPLLYPQFDVKLASDEVYVVQVAKKRLVILMSSPSTPWRVSSGRTRENCCLVAPVYSFNEGHSGQWRCAVGNFQFEELFYVPKSTTHTIADGYVRFDRVQTVPRAWLGRARVALHPDLLKWVDD
ncbi:unnamed protein product, partial [marine sediment metagenome]